MREDRPIISINQQQRRVLGELTRDGATNKEIAERLGLTPETVRTHMQALLLAFRVKNRTAVVVLCLRELVVVRTRGRYERRVQNI